MGGIGSTMALNLWETSSSKVPVTFRDGDFQGEYNPADIRGSYSFDNVSSLFNIPLEDLGRAFGLSDGEDIANFKNKDLESRYEDLKSQGKEVGNDSVKNFVSLYTGLPYDLSEDTYLLKPAIDILKRVAVLSQEQITYLESHTVDVPSEVTSIINSEEVVLNNEKADSISNEENVTTSSNIVVTSDEKADGDNSSAGAVVTNTTPVNNEAGPGQGNPDSSDSTDHEEQSEMSIKGKTTFRELLDWGVPEETIEEIISNRIPNPLIIIRDYCSEKDLEFSKIKELLQQKIDELK